MSARIARDVGAWLSATDKPEHSGHLNSVSRPCARAASDCSPLGQSTTASATTTTSPSAIHGPQRLIIVAGSFVVPRGRHELLERACRERTVVRRRDDAAG